MACAEGLEGLLVLACYVSSQFLRRPLDPPAVVNTLGGAGWEERTPPPLREKKEKPKERPDASKMVSHFVKRIEREAKYVCVLWCPPHHGPFCS